MHHSIETCNLLCFAFLLLTLLSVYCGLSLGQLTPNISASREFQTANKELILECIPWPKVDTKLSQLTFEFNNTQVYNSDTKLADGVKYLSNITTPSIEVLNRKSYLKNVVCAYNGTSSRNYLDIPYLNIDEYQHSGRLEINQKVTISCSLAITPFPSNYTSYNVLFLVNQTVYFEFNTVGQHYHQFKYNNLSNLNGAIISPVGGFGYPTYSIQFQPTENIENLRNGTMHCELEYNNGNHKNFKVQSEPFDLSKNNSNTRLFSSNSALVLACVGLVTFLLTV